MALRIPSYAELVNSIAARGMAASVVAAMKATMHGARNVPRTGGALIVGNHTLFGIDSFVLAALVQLNVDRPMRWLAERNLFRAPGVAQALRWVGAIEGTPEAAVELLRAGELVGVYPGGVDDSFKLSTERYVLQWGARAGFARVATRAGVPIVPIAATGIDELFDVHTRETRFARTLFGSSRYDVPIPNNVLPRRVPLNYHALAPIETSGLPDDSDRVERVRAATFEALESVLRPYRESLAQGSVGP